MRNNIVFGNIDKAPLEENTESLVRDVLMSKMRIASDYVHQIKFERVRGIGNK
jgi:hypothetical protein